jgi:hypothetical protein
VEADAVGIRSALAVSLSADQALAAVDMYSRFPRTFGVVDRAKAVILAQLAKLAVSLAHARDAQERLAGEFQAGLITREVIGQAEGILMERERITSDQAFDVLRRASQYLNIKLRDVAQALVDTGESPQTGPAAS